MKRSVLSALLLCVPLPAFATLTTYSDRTSFDTDAPGLPVEDFEESLASAGTFLTIPAPLDSTSSNDAFSPGDILEGLQLADQPGPDSTGLIALGAGLTPTFGKSLLANTFADSLNLIFPDGTTAVGFDFGATASAGTISVDNLTIKVFDTDGNSLGSFPVTSSDSSPAFFGVISDAALIGRINIFSGSNKAEIVDNIAFGIAQAPLGFCQGKAVTHAGDEKNNSLTGTPGDDVIAGFGGNDTIDGGGGRDLICGGPGNDLLIGGPGNDLLIGDNGVDKLVGGKGDDRLLGGGGQDSLDGGAGKDLCDGGAAVDKAQRCETIDDVP